MESVSVELSVPETLSDERSRSVDLSSSGSSFPFNWKPVMLFYHPQMERLAKSIVDIGTKKAKMFNLRSVQLCSHIKWDRFRDGWPNIFIDKIDEVAGRDVIFVATFHSPEIVFEELSLIYSFPRYFARSFRLILPFFPTGTMERIDKEGQVVTAKTLARMLSVIPLAARGPAQIIIFDIHALQERFYFTDQVIPRLLTAIPYLITELHNLPDSKNLAIVFPDEGAHKRFHVFFHDWPLITCIKTREGDNRNVLIKEGNPKGRHVVIIDDLVQTGGTLIECSKALHQEGVTAISLFVTHAVFPNKSWEKFTTIDLPISKFWITDSLPHAIEITSHSPFQLLSLAEGIVDSLLTQDLLKQ